MSVKQFPVDPAFPQLRIATDPESMREVFQEHLRPLGERSYHIRDCHLSRIRYRQGARCVLQYTLSLAEPGTGRERSQWVTGVMYAENRTRRKWEKLRASGMGQDIPDAFATFEPFAFIPDLEMLVQVFPYDRRLPALPLLMAGPSPEIEPPILARFEPGDWHVEAWNVEPVRYRAELGAALRLTVQARDAATSRTQERRFYAKVYPDEDTGERTYQGLRALWNEVSPDGEGFTVARPIAYLGSLRTLLQEEASGTSLQDILLQDNGTTLAMRQAASALAALHLGNAATPQHRPLEDEVAALERSGRLLRWACPRLATEVDAIVGAVAAGLEEAPSAPTHGDLKADHILLDGDRLTLLDLEWFADTDPLLDSASILAELASMPLRSAVPPHRSETAALVFADEYFSRVPRAWRSRLPGRYAGAALKEAAGFFRRQEPDWPSKIATLMKEARDSLAGRVW